MTLAPGLQAAFRYTVTAADTAAAVGRGEVPVLATPAGAGPGRAGDGSRGRRCAGGGCDHGRGPGRAGPPGPSPVEAEPEVQAVLERVAGRRLQFAARARDGDRLVASGLITRVVVDTAAFPRAAGAKAAL